MTACKFFSKMLHWVTQGSGKTHFLALFVVWYLTYLANKSVRIGITAYTRAAVHNLLHRIVQVRRHNTKADFKLISMVREFPKEPVEGMISCQARAVLVAIWTAAQL
jgi:hypothetical protein